MSEKVTKKGQRTKQDYIRIFKEFDMDNSGGVSKDQIIKVLKACQIDIDASEAQDIINEIDADGGGQVEQDQFIAFLQREDTADNYTESEMRKLFSFFLKEGQDKIGFEEIKQMLLNLGQKVVQSEVLAMLAYADKDQDGYLNFQEFDEIIRSV